MLRADIPPVKVPQLCNFFQLGGLWLPVWARGLGALCIFLTAAGPSLHAQSYPDALPGFVHSNNFDSDSAQKHGIVLDGRGILYSSPAVADLDGDSTNGLEVVVGGADGMLYAFSSSGESLWTAPMPNYNCSGASKSNKLLSSPAIGDLDGDGIAEALVGWGGGGIGKNCGGGVLAVNGRDGSRKWTFDLEKFARKMKFGSPTGHTVFSSPALADVDGDGKLEVGFGSFDRNVYLLEFNGKVRWYYNAADTVWSSPAFANVDNDPELEMIIGTDISANGALRPPTKNGGFVYAFDTAKRSRKRIGFREEYVWQTYLDQVVYSSPVVADVLSSNPGNEVLVASGCYFSSSGNDKKGKWVKILSATTGAVLQTLETTGCAPSNVAVGDIDGDNALEVVVTSNGHGSIGGDGFGRVHAFDPETSEPKWSAIPRVRGNNEAFAAHMNSPIIADVDGNGSNEVLVANSSGIVVYEGSTGEALTCQDSSCESQSTIYAWGALRSTPAVADLNLDGILDLVIGGLRGKKGALYAWTNLAEVISSSSGSGAPYAAPWPMHRGNARHTGLYLP